MLIGWSCRARLTTALSLAALAVTAGCMPPSKDLDPALKRPAVESKYIVTLQPPVQPAAINQLHMWHVLVALSAGAPVPNARIKVDGGMPPLGHGMPTRPQGTRELPDGRYLMECMKFSMTGWWEIKLAVDGPKGADRVTFNAVVAEAGATR